MYNYAAAMLQTDVNGDQHHRGRDGDSAATAATPTAITTSGASEALEARYLAQIKKNKDLTVQLESAKTRERQLQERLDAANAEREKLARQAQPRQQAARGKRKQQPSSTAASTAAGRRALHDQLPFLDAKDGERGSDVGGSGDGEEEEGESRDSVVRLLKERLERAYGQVRERDVQLSEVKRDAALLKGILARELGKTPEELAGWLAQSGSANPTSTSLEAPAGWRGRAEQIVLLKGKLKDMERVVAAYQSGEELPAGAGTFTSGRGAGDTESEDRGDARAEAVACLVADGGGDDLESLMRLAQQTCPASEVPFTGAGGTSTSANNKSNKNKPSDSKRVRPSVPPSATSNASLRTGGTVAKRDVDDTARDALGELAGRRLQTLRELESALAQAEAAVQEERVKQAALQARLVALKRDNVQLRSHVQVMLEKSSSDDALVAAYREELEQAAAALVEAKRELAEQLLDDEEEERRRRDGPRGVGAAPAAHPQEANSGGDGAKSNAGSAALVAALTRENAELKARVQTLLAHGNPTSAPAAVTHSYQDRVTQWALDVAGVDGGGANTAAEAHPPIAALLRAAHTHLLLVERRLQSVEESQSRLYATHNSSSSTKEKKNVVVVAPSPTPPLPQALLVENANLKERVKSLTELLKREAEVR